jgi:3-hydroxyacyl-CoA dehydrogenase
LRALFKGETALNAAINRVAVVGTGLIGASWASYFLARGLDVTATDPSPGAEARLREAVTAQWGVLRQIGLSANASLDRLRFVSRLEDAVQDAGLVQENGPETLAFKRDIFQAMDAAAPDNAILATSSSSIMVSEFQDTCAKNPGRVVLAHPFNPPHLIPLVEVAGGTRTSPEAVHTAMEFYKAIGKHPIHLKKEVRGHVANRLQAALWREAFSLAEKGVASIADIDAAIAHGPGLRWALLGPFMNLHLSGGAGGLGGLFGKPLWQATESIWRDLGTVSVDAGLRNSVVQGISEELKGRDGAAIVRERDEALLALLALKAQAKQLP